MTVPLQGPTCSAVLAGASGEHLIEVVRQTGTYYERDLLDFLRGLDIGGLYIDVGAHCGNHTLFFALECPSTGVIAIEPHPETAEELRETVRLNNLGNVRVVETAIHPTNRRLGLSEDNITLSRRPNRGMARVVEGDEVDAIPLDEVTDEPVALIKVDVEGLEPVVLRSGLRMISAHRPVIAVEVNKGLDDIRALLEPFGYQAVGSFGITPVWVFVV